MLLGTDLRHLKKLKISVLEAQTRSSLVKSLIQSIKNVPNLTHICLNGFLLSLKGLESIHADALNLETMDLTNTILDIIPDHEVVVSRDCHRLIYGDGSDLVKTEAENVRHLNIDIVCDWNDLNFQATVRKWITYIGQKYENVEALHVAKFIRGINNFLHSVMRTLEEPLTKAISKMARLSDYEFTLYPLTESVARALDDNNHAGLENLALFINNNNYTEQLHILDTFKFPDSVKDLVKKRKSSCF